MAVMHKSGPVACRRGARGQLRRCAATALSRSSGCRRGAAGKCGLVQELGGAETGPRAAYVQAVGRRVGAYSGIANAGQALHFTTLNSAVENAFSVPGGYVYVTRQLLGLMDDESELAFALGHEVGHVAANHAHAREEYVSASPLAWIGQAIGSIFGGCRLLQRARAASTSCNSRASRNMRPIAGHPVHGRGRLRSGRAAELPCRAEPRKRARSAGSGARQSPDAGMGEYSSAERKPDAARARRRRGRPAGWARGFATATVFLSQIEGIYVDDDPAQGIIDGPSSPIPICGSSSGCRRVI